MKQQYPYQAKSLFMNDLQCMGPTTQNFTNINRRRRFCRLFILSLPIIINTRSKD